MIETRGWNASLGSDLCNACSQTRRKLMSLKVTRGEEALILLQQEMRRYLICPRLLRRDFGLRRSLRQLLGLGNRSSTDCVVFGLG